MSRFGSGDDLRGSYPSVYLYEPLASPPIVLSLHLLSDRHVARRVVSSINRSLELHFFACTYFPANTYYSYQDLGLSESYPKETISKRRSQVIATNEDLSAIIIRYGFLFYGYILVTVGHQSD